MLGRWRCRLPGNRAVPPAAVLFTLLCVVLAVWGPEVVEGQPLWVTLCGLLTLLSALSALVIWRQPQSKEALMFKVRPAARSPPFLTGSKAYFYMALFEDEGHGVPMKTRTSVKTTT